MKYILLLLLMLSAHVLAEEAADPNVDFAEEYIQQFELGMSVTTVREILLKKQQRVELLNKCTEQLEYPVTDCDKGYNLVTTIRLADSETLGRSDLQLYFSFDAKQQLLNSFYEIYYTEQFKQEKA